MKLPQAVSVVVDTDGPSGPPTVKFPVDAEHVPEDIATAYVPAASPLITNGLLVYAIEAPPLML